MTCKEYDKIIKEFDNAISALNLIKNSSWQILETLNKINFNEEEFKLLCAKKNFIEFNKRGEK